MIEKLWRYVYDVPPWSVIVPQSTLDRIGDGFLPRPDRVVDLGEWEIERGADDRTDEDAP